MKLNNLLPRDTRIIELLSAVSIPAASLGIVMDSAFASIVTSDTPKVFILLVFCIIGFLQLISLLEYPKLELLRCTTALVAGMFWIWLFLASDTSCKPTMDFMLLFTAIGNFYAFLLAHRGL